MNSKEKALKKIYDLEKEIERLKEEVKAFLATSNGQWYDKDGYKISDYLFYKPNKE